MDTGVRDLEVACFKANSTWINDINEVEKIYQKDLSNRPIYNITKAKRALWLANLASTICPWVYAADVCANV